LLGLGGMSDFLDDVENAGAGVVSWIGSKCLLSDARFVNVMRNKKR